MISQKRTRFKDLHVIRFYSSYVIISNGKVVSVTDPEMSYCPLANHLYRGLKLHGDSDFFKEAIKKAVELKISRFGHFTEKRRILRKGIAIPYGASEILMYAMRKNVIDAAVVACDGAGTVVSDRPDVVQGIGARMNGLFYTTPIGGVIRELKRSGALVAFKDGGINQAGGVTRAASAGYKDIAVTVNASMDEPFRTLRQMEKRYGISLTILAICTTGIHAQRVKEIGRYADLVWSCASDEVRTLIGRKSLIQLSRKIPVFALTGKGLELVKAYSSDKDIIAGLDPGCQYIIASGNRGMKLKMGISEARLCKTRLPVRDRREPAMKVSNPFRKKLLKVNDVMIRIS